MKNRDRIGARLQRAAQGEMTFAELLAEFGWPSGVTLDAATALRLRDAWRLRYGAGLRPPFLGSEGCRFEWEAFGRGTVPFVERDAAVAAYSSQSGPVVVLTAEIIDGPQGARFPAPPPIAAAQKTNRERRRAGGGLPQDMLIFPESLAWTFSTTHEWGWCGPYFAPFVRPPEPPRPPRTRSRNGSRR